MEESKNNQEQERAEPFSYTKETLLEQLDGNVKTDLDLSVEDQLALSQASRTHAESERQRVASGILDATRQACQELISDGEKVLIKAKRLEIEADRKHQTAQGVLERTNVIRAEADAYADKVKREADANRAEADAHAERVMAESQHQAADLVERARVAAQRECAELKQQASFEAKQMLGQAQVIRAAAQEELEAHRIYAEAARLNAESHEVLVHARTRLDESEEFQSKSQGTVGSPASSEVDFEVDTKVASDDHSAILELAEGWQGVDEAEDFDTIADELEAMKEIAAKAAQLSAEPVEATNSKKSPRKAKMAS